MSAAVEQGSVRAVLRPRGRVLILTPPGPDARAMADCLGRLGHTVVATDDPEQATLAVQEEDVDLALIDATLAGAVDGVRLATHAVLLGTPGVPSGEPAPPVGYLATLEHPVPAAALQAIAEIAAVARRLEHRCASLALHLEGLRDGSAMIGRSPVMRRLATVLRRAADSDATVLVEGPTGSGKSLAAHVVHNKGRRCDRRIVVLPASTVDAAGMAAALEEACGTTLLIEDVDQLPAAAQSTLVRHLKERPPAGAGGAPPARILATTSARLPEMIARGVFREDLYYRLNVFPVVVPALRERRDDIPLLAHYFQELHSAGSGSSVGGFTASSMILLESHPWPGNVAQLESVIRRAVALAAGGVIDRLHLLGPGTGLTPAPEPTAEAVGADDDDETPSEESIRPLQDEEQRLLSRALRATKGNVRRAAKLLGIGRATLYRKIQIYQLKLN